MGDPHFRIDLLIRHLAASEELLDRLEHRPPQMMARARQAQQLQLEQTREEVRALKRRIRYLRERNNAISQVHARNGVPPDVAKYVIREFDGSGRRRQR